MVVPMTSDSKPKSKTRRIIGDGQRIIMRTNSDSLLVIGSGNRVEVDCNDGDIRVVGDGCKVLVNTGRGTINYKGDGGSLHTGSISLNNITYVGDGGRIISSEGITKTTHKCAKSKSFDVPKSEKDNGNIFVRNQTNCHIKVPSLKNTNCIRITIPKIVTSKSKHS